MIDVLFPIKNRMLQRANAPMKSLHRAISKGEIGNLKNYHRMDSVTAIFDSLTKIYFLNQPEAVELSV